MVRWCPCLLDVFRAALIVAALVVSVRRRFLLGIAYGAVLLLAMAAVSTDAYAALRAYSVGGEYAIGFVFVGPTLLPLGGSEWLPVAVEVSIATLAAVPAWVSTQRQLSLAADPERMRGWNWASNLFLTVFSTSAALAVTSALTTWLLWRETH